MADKRSPPPSEPPSTKIFLVDDHRLFRAGLRALIEQMPHFKVVGEASTAAQAFTLVSSARPDVVVMDIHLPDGNGIAVSRHLLKENPDIRILALSSDPSAALVHEAMLAGIGGYLLKENTTDELVRAIQAVLARNVYLCPEVSTAIMDNYRQHYGAAPSPAPTKPTLSDREIAMLRYIAEGLRNKEIAEQLGLTVKSAETYRQRLMQKLQLDSTAALTRYAIREGVIKA